jgi:hypothetical protein
VQNAKQLESTIAKRKRKLRRMDDLGFHGQESIAKILQRMLRKDFGGKLPGKWPVV